MENLINVGKLTLVLLAVASIVFTFVEEWRNYRFIWQVWKRFRIKMFFEVFGIILLMVVAIIALLEVPGLKYGWANLFFSGGGNILVAPILDASGSASILIRLVVPLFFFALMLMLPFLSRSEERRFRKGYNEWGSILKQSVKFGLMHCLVGIPLAAGIGLIITGFFLGYKYKRAFDSKAATLNYSQAEDEAVMVSTTYHTMYNSILVTVMLIVVLTAVL